MQRLFVLILTLLFASTAQAHHSTNAGFDREARTAVIPTAIAAPTRTAAMTTEKDLPKPEEVVASQKQDREKFFRRELGFDFDTTDEGFTPNFSKMKDDLDVPSFLRKQMD